MHTSLNTFLCQTLEDQVYWVEREGARQQTVLYSAPIEVGPILETQFFKEVPCVIMTSATLAVQGKLDYFKRRVGATNCETMDVGTPFDYARQMRIQISQKMPDPNDRDNYAKAACTVIQSSIRSIQGGTFVLFTNARFMRQVAEQMAQDIEEMGYRCLVQGAELPRNVMLETFRQDGKAVLFGLDSFWMGVDVPGAALSQVIITRLPFAVPDHPVVEARMRRIREHGGDPFREYSLPEAIIKMRQGVGRLIRSTVDEGRIVILDPRVSTRGYGRTFLSSLPECPVEVMQ